MREELFDIFNSIEFVKMDVFSFLELNWNLGYLNGSYFFVCLWGKSGDLGYVLQDFSVCWDVDGSVKFIGLEDMIEEECFMFLIDVNLIMKLFQLKQF